MITYYLVLVCFPWPLRTSKNRKVTVFRCFQGVGKGCIGNEWVKDVKTILSEIMILRLARVLFGITSSLFFINCYNQTSFGKYLPKANYRSIIQFFILNFYVYDSVSTFNHVEDVIQFYENSNSGLAHSNFSLRKWATNNKKIQKFRISQQNQKIVSETFLILPGI